jgi:hypothetical protein
MRGVSLAFLFTLCVAPLLAAAATSGFSVRLQVVADNTPPSTPTLLSAVPVAATQIDLMWSASTDDTAVAGYTLNRNGFHIATTTLTAFSDIGLAPATFYEYSVRAFDSFFNFSTSSNLLGTTTLALPPPPPPAVTDERRPSTGAGRLFLRYLVIETGFSTTSFLWSTDRPSRFELRWGLTPSYELGFISGEVYRETHATMISDLAPDTTYHYELVGYTAALIPHVLSRGVFTTKPPLKRAAVPNVTRFSAVADGHDVILNWQRPPALDEAVVRIMRHHRWYPGDTNDGLLVYQGDASRARDSNALLRHDVAYYTAFVVDREGNVSSGAIARVSRAPARAAPPPPEDLPPEEVLPPALPPLAWPPVPLESIILTQGDISYAFSEAEIRLRSDLPFTISIPFAAPPPRLKSIVATLIDPTDNRRSHSFLLRINRERTAYEATLAPLFLVGDSRLSIEIFDYEAAVVGRYTNGLSFVMPSVPVAEAVFPDTILAFMPLILAVFFCLLFLLLFILWRLSRRRQ